MLITIYFDVKLYRDIKANSSKFINVKKWMVGILSGRRGSGHFLILILNWIPLSINIASLRGTFQTRSQKKTIEKLSHLRIHRKHWIYHQTPAIAHCAFVGFRLRRPNVVCSEKSSRTCYVQSEAGVWR